MMEEQSTEKYYVQFSKHVSDNYKIDGFYTIRYDTQLKKWFQYEGGVYNIVPIEFINGIYEEAMMVGGIDESNRKLAYCVKKLAIWTQFNGKWIDNTPNLDNCLNGILDLTTRELEPHHLSFMFRYQIPRNFIQDVDPIIPELYEKVLTCITNETQRDLFNRFFINVIHKRFDDEVFMMLYGVKGGGKSTLIQIFTELYGPESTSKTGLHKLGSRFGKKEMYDKRVNCEPDLPIIPLKPYTISELKKLTGEDGYIEVELKRVDVFKYPISCFLVFGINQLMGFSADAEKEIDSVMRRAVLVECPIMQKKDAKFKRAIRNPNFLDILYSWAVHIKPIPIYEPEEEDEWIRSNKELWLLNSDPILRICQECYEYCSPDTIKHEGDETTIVRKIKVTEVLELVSDTLDEEGFIVPKHTSVQSLITQALKTMKIYKNKKVYENIVRREE